MEPGLRSWRFQWGWEGPGVRVQGSAVCSQHPRLWGQNRRPAEDGGHTPAAGREETTDGQVRHLQGVGTLSELKHVRDMSSLLWLRPQTVSAKQIPPCERGRGGASAHGHQSRYSRPPLLTVDSCFQGDGCVPNPSVSQHQQSPACRPPSTSPSSCRPCRRSQDGTCLSAGNNTASCCRASSGRRPRLSNTGASSR